VIVANMIMAWLSVSQEPFGMAGDMLYLVYPGDGTIVALPTSKRIE
jgi:hypothetical protein